MALVDKHLSRYRELQQKSAALDRLAAEALAYGDDRQARQLAAQAGIAWRGSQRFLRLTVPEVAHVG